MDFTFFAELLVWPPAVSIASSQHCRIIIEDILTTANQTPRHGQIIAVPLVRVRVSRDRTHVLQSGAKLRQGVSLAIYGALDVPKAPAQCDSTCFQL
jgi:hypothetical protein